MKKIYFTDSDLLSAIADNPTYIPDNTKLYTFLSKLKISLALLNKLSNKEVRKILLSQAELHIKNLKDTEKTKIWNGIHINQYWIKKNIYAKLEKKKYPRLDIELHEITGIEKSKLRYYLKHGYHFAYTKHELLPFASGLTDCKNDTKTKPIESFQRADAYMVEFFCRLADLASDLSEIVKDIKIENYEKLNNGSDTGFSEIDFNNLKREYPEFKNKESIFSDSYARQFFTRLKKSWIAKEVLTIEQKEVLDIFNKKPFAGRLTIEKAKKLFQLSEILRLFADIAKYQEPTFAEYKTFAYTGTWNDFYMYSKGYYNFESKKFRVNNKPKISKSDFQLLENPEFPDKKTELEFYKKISVQIIKIGKVHLKGTIIGFKKEVSNTDIKKIVEYIDFQNELKSSFNVYETNKRKNENKRIEKR